MGILPVIEGLGRSIEAEETHKIPHKISSKKISKGESYMVISMGIRLVDCDDPVDIPVLESEKLGSDIDS